MPTPSSISRYRPAVLIFTGAAAAYAAWLLYDSFRTPPEGGLRRSNALRRTNNRTRARSHLQPARIAQQLLAEPTPLGEFDFLGHTITLDSRNLMAHYALLALGRELQPHASDDMIESRIDQLYDLYIDRLLGSLSQGRALEDIPIAELTAMLSVTDEQSPSHRLVELFQSIRNRTAVDDRGSIPPTEAGDWDEDIPGDAEGQTLQRTLYHIAEDRARHEGVVHRGITCNGCDSKPIRGIRWHCANCADFDLCSDCEATNSHSKTHIFYKIRVPAPNLSITKQEPLYPGRPDLMNPSIDARLKRRLVNDTRMEAEEIEALWDQFTCLATTSWTKDPSGVGWALDRRAFNHAFIPRYSSFKSAPNLIYDRVFSYFDTDHNTLIGFEEFVKGIDGLHTTDTHVKLRIAFNGYDVDGDGYISRKDVLRIFRAHYAIEREATRNYLTESAEEMSVRGALEVIQSAQPLGSAFTQGAIIPGEPNWLLGVKPPDDEINASPIIENRPDTLDRTAIITSTHPLRDRGGGEGERILRSAVNDRWARRQFYTDEEEGFTCPGGVDDGPLPIMLDDRRNQDPEDELDENEENEPPTPERERPRGSRSSSRVRFQDDIDVETRSNASTSSRLVGERWGGYEIPEPEKDLGNDILYQIVQQAFNELLDPLFKRGEDAAMDAYAEREERRRHVTDIDLLLGKYNTEQDLLKRMVGVGVFTYVNSVVKSFSAQDFSIFSANAPLSPAIVNEMTSNLFDNAEASAIPLTESRSDEPQPEDDILWTMMLYRTQLLNELAKAMRVLARRQGWMLKTTSMIAPPSPSTENDEEPALNRDPTLPQFRPNSLSDPAKPPVVTTSKGSAANDPTMSARASFGPLFVVPSRPDASTSADNRPATEVGTAPYALDEHGITLSRPIPLPDPAPHPVMHIFSFDANGALADETRLLSQHPSFDPDAPQPSATFHKAIVDAAYAAPNAQDADLHLRLVVLARWEGVDRRDGERKGAGKINFDEFERAAREGRMRFLESWMDWVSF
ncbi:hypothetical protein BU23DRAFT_507321 [Bimuria novae-zelandiae CBS 107.79]|uniref:EF-hand n=1 Tax=Bimuria novae-zelandiae CBS 107.79 TaxID=1447943 RepID=A0A6A5VAH5_9PLEO|nr:hypothetical protein BU23DRAFT_507321 [Bimuria novae-zelandiae CBS 107.79]